MRPARFALALLLCAAFPSRLCAATEPVPVYRDLPEPRVLVLADSPNHEEWAEQLRRVVPAQVTFAPLDYSESDCARLTDKPFDLTRADVELVARKGRAWVDAALARLNDFDVVITRFALNREPDIQKRLADWVAHGGRLVCIAPAQEVSFAKAPLATVLPVKAGRRQLLTTGSAGATDHPLTRGLALEITGADWYGPVYEPADASCRPLSRVDTLPDGQDAGARFWYRRLPGGGQVVHLYAAGGNRREWEEGTDYATYAPDRPDDSAAWDAFYRRLVCGLAYGDRAFPVLTRVVLENRAPVRSGAKLVFGVDLENRSGEEREVRLTVDLSQRRSDRGQTEVRHVTLKPGERRTIPLEMPVSLPCSDSWLQVRARALDASGQRLFSESTAWLPYVHKVPLTLDAGVAACRPGGVVRPTLAWTNDAPAGAYTGALYLVDRTGRALWKAEAPLTILPKSSGHWSFFLTMPDGGPEFAGSYWLVAVIRAGDEIAGMATAQLQVERPWNMRDRFTWSVGSGGADPRKMRLLLDAGFNALGQPGNSGQADRYGLRQCVDAIGLNAKDLPVEQDNWQAVRAAMETRIAGLNAAGPDARSKALIMPGAEDLSQAGMKERFHPLAGALPAAVERFFGAYLKALYAGDIGELNRQWNTTFADFSDIPLEPDQARPPGEVFVTAAAWEAMANKGGGGGLVPVNVTAPDPGKTYLAYSAPYYEHARFLDWCAAKYRDLATTVYRERRNPVPLIVPAMPEDFQFRPSAGVSHFAGLGPHRPKEAALAENVLARRDGGDVPGSSGALRACYDLFPLWNAVVLSAILAGNTHIEYRVDTPLTLNADVTHTRASFWTKQLREKLRPLEPILLHKHIACTQGLGLYVPAQPLPDGLCGTHFSAAGDPNAPVYAALAETGYLPQAVDLRQLDGVHVLIASYAQVVSAADGKRLAAFVRQGGTLISTPWLASCSAHGNALSVYPAEESGLRELLGFSLIQTSQAAADETLLVELPAAPAAAGRSAESAKLRLNMLSRGRDRVRDPAPDVKILGRYRDGTPLILTRRVGRGTVVYLNFVYDWNTDGNGAPDPAREAYRRLYDYFIRADGRIANDFFVAFESAVPAPENKGSPNVTGNPMPKPGEAVPWWAGQMYADLSGRVKYLALFADYDSPTVTARVHVDRPGLRVMDLLKAGEVPATQPPRLTLRPGEAALWAISPWLPTTIEIEAPRGVDAGARVPITVRIPGAAEAGIDCGVVVDVFGPGGQRLESHSLRTVNVAKGHVAVTIPTALNDPPGRYRLVVTESLTRRQAASEFLLVADGSTPPPGALTPFPARAADTWRDSDVDDDTFLKLLRELRTLYRGTHEGLEAKYMLSYYLNVPFRPTNRHGLARQLQRTNWRPHLGAVEQAMRAGEKFVLLGEDLNRDPVTGDIIDPLAVADIPGFLEALAGLQGARRSRTRVEGIDFDVVRLGNGTFIAVLASVDRTAYLSSDFAGWHAVLQRALVTVEEGDGKP